MGAVEVGVERGGEDIELERPLNSFPGRARGLRRRGGQGLSCELPFPAQHSDFFVVLRTSAV